jgi:hypothetical protein
MRNGLMLALALLFCLVAVGAFAAPPPDGITMNKTKNPVLFNHSTHTDLACGDCHHPVKVETPASCLAEGCHAEADLPGLLEFYTDGEDYRPCSTAGCHQIFDAKDKSVHSYYQAMHKSRKPEFDSCYSCHVKTAGKDKERKRLLSSCSNYVCHE